jgi:hypothetical protein
LNYLWHNSFLCSRFPSVKILKVSRNINNYLCIANDMPRWSQWPLCLRHEMSALIQTLRLWVQGMEVCLHLFCVVLSYVGSSFVSGWPLSKESYGLSDIRNWSETKPFMDVLCSKWEQQEIGEWVGRMTHPSNVGLVCSRYVFLFDFELFLSCRKCIKFGISMILGLLSNFKQYRSCHNYEVFLNSVQCMYDYCNNNSSLYIHLEACM